VTEGRSRPTENRLGVALPSSRTLSVVCPDRVRPEARDGAGNQIGSSPRRAGRNTSCHGERDRRLSVLRYRKCVSIRSGRAASIRPLASWILVLDQLIKGSRAVAGLFHIRRQRAGARLAQHAGKQSAATGVQRSLRRIYAAGQAAPSDFSLIGQVLHAIGAAWDTLVEVKVLVSIMSAPASR